MTTTTTTTVPDATGQARRDSSRVTIVLQSLRTAESEIRAAYGVAETIENGDDRTRILAALSVQSSAVRHAREAIALGG